MALVFALTLALILTLGYAAPARNPYLASSPFPICHGAFKSANVTKQLLFHPAHLLELADPISLVFGPDGFVWGSTISHIIRLEINTNMTLVAELVHNRSFEFHGAYSLVTVDNEYFAADMSSISAYRLATPSDPRSSIVRQAVYLVPGCVDGEHLVGLSMTFDGVLVYATSAGRVGAVDRAFSRGAPALQLPDRDTVLLPLKMISNNFAVDQHNGIYVVTSVHQHRIQWNNSTYSLSLSDGRDPWFYGRLGPGSGSSPTIVGPTGEPELVVVTDGQTPMNIRFFRTGDGAACGVARVDFGGLGNSTSEQSVVVAGNRAMVVNNWWTGKAGQICENATAKNPWIEHVCPAMLGEAAFGVSQFVVDSASCSVQLAWTNKHVSCTSAIPVVSLADNIAYCLGKRGLMFTIEAIDWMSGASLFHVPLGEGLQYNSMYAGTEIGARNDIIMGTMGGILRVA